MTPSQFDSVAKPLGNYSKTINWNVFVYQRIHLTILLNLTSKNFPNVWLFSRYVKQDVCIEQKYWSFGHPFVFRVTSMTKVVFQICCWLWKSLDRLQNSCFPCFQYVSLHKRVHELVISIFKGFQGTFHALKTTVRFELTAFPFERNIFYFNQSLSTGGIKICKRETFTGNCCQHWANSYCIQ